MRREVVNGGVRWCGAALLCLIASTVLGHPLGNYSINQYLMLDLRGERPTLYYLLDLAEIPSFSELDFLDTDFDSVVSLEEEAAYLDLRVPELASNIRLAVDGRPIPFEVVDRRLALTEGSAAMVVINILVTLGPATGVWPEPGDDWQIEIVSTNHQEAVGIRECKLLMDERFVDRTEVTDRKRLGYQTRVFTDRRGNPVYQDFDARFVLSLGPGSGRADSEDRPSPAFGWTATARAARDSGDRLMEQAFGQVYAELTAGEKEAPAGGVPATPRPVLRRESSEAPDLRDADQRVGRMETGTEGSLGVLYDRVSAVIRSDTVTPTMFLLGLGLAMVLGAAHARSPGHGKTVMAAYLVGERGTVGHAVLLGLVVTITHTWSVVLLGVVTLSLREHIAEETLSFWMGIASGVLIAAIGLALFLKRHRAWVLARHGHVHDHARGHSHDHDHDHGHVVRSRDGPAPSYWSILGLGISGGIVPCPTALIVLLLAIRFGRLGYGLALILAFSFGLALVLILIGVLVVKASSWVQRISGAGGRLQLLSVLSSALIVLLGLWVVVWTLLQYNILVIRP
jgi:ABC-type nickel/cobalt efflux system permease component RcnA